jgi:mono/diheme cytochrome c family protein
MRIAPACWIALLISVAWVSAAGSQDQGNADNGKAVFLADGCFECHGRVGEGGFFNYPVPALAQVRLPLEAFKAIVRLGPNDMPAYSPAVLSDAELADIYAYLRSLPGARPVQEVPLLHD